MGAIRRRGGDGSAKCGGYRARDVLKPSHGVSSGPLYGMK